ncbi:cell wall hydrolase [Loktanella sp. PT4BL]|jgi:spore germination cell wall hydrolase CwlJ-like protein|uniref:cell wall hydrolase n=1 Tax=Loktanella sp. PT4BL TaxID=2135611 RepID=UPI000D75DE59|nr:cell wall hydrolase [Loktanella sp. PT4BL]PXW70874.1 cell wall hydrolase [Loktanella sp. PT4BL]
MTVLKAIIAACFAAVISVGATSAFADEVMASRLEAILGQERQALSVVPDSRLSMLTSLPPAQERGVETQTGLVYDRDYLAELPAADGGSEWQCLAEALYFEARGESVRGMFAVGEVIMNRVDSSAYPDSLCAVINQGTGRRYACQFTYTCDGKPEVIAELRSWERVGKVARMLIDGAPRALTGGATHYHTKAVNPSWAQRFPRTASIGFHYFYRQPVRTASM